jgi:hypothetical protein
MDWTTLLAIITLSLYIFIPHLNLQSLRKGFSIVLFLQLFYLIGYYLADWPFPTPFILLQIFIAVGLGVALGSTFSKIWLLPPHIGFERVIRTLLLVIPAFGIGIGLQVLLQGVQSTQAIYLIFAISAWLGSGQFVRKDEKEQEVQKVKRATMR